MLTGGLDALPFDLLKDLEPIIQIGREPPLIAGKNNLQADALKGLTERASFPPAHRSRNVVANASASHPAFAQRALLDCRVAGR